MNEKITKNSPVVYICSPYKGKTPAEQDDNVRAARKYGRFAVQQGYIPYIAHLAVCGFLDDSVSAERSAGIIIDSVMIERACDQLWVFGDRLSPGMQAEIRQFLNSGKPIKYFSSGCDPLDENAVRTLMSQMKFPW